MSARARYSHYASGTPRQPPALLGPGAGVSAPTSSGGDLVVRRRPLPAGLGTIAPVSSIECAKFTFEIEHWARCSEGIRDIARTMHGCKVTLLDTSVESLRGLDGNRHVWVEVIDTNSMKVPCADFRMLVPARSLQPATF